MPMVSITRSSPLGPETSKMPYFLGFRVLGSRNWWGPFNKDYNVLGLLPGLVRDKGKGLGFRVYGLGVQGLRFRA